MTAGMLLPLYTTIRISPMRLLGMLLWGAVGGAVLGALYDVFRISRVFVGVRYPSRTVQALYRMPLPLLGRPVRAPAERGGQVLYAVLRHVLIFVQDLVFGVLWGVVMVLVVYYTNDGQWRIMAPVGMLCGYLAYDRTLGRLIRSLSQSIVWLLRAVMCYVTALVTLPFRLLGALWRRTVGAWWHRHREIVRARRAAAYHEQTWRMLRQRAEHGWLISHAGTSTHQGGWRHAKTGNRKENDDRFTQRADLSDADRGVCHRLFCDQDDGKQQAEKGKRRVAPSDRGSPTTGRRSAISRRRAGG